MTPQERAQDIKALFVAVFAFLTALWGWLGWAVFILVIAMVTDYITGSMAANANGEWSSEIARAGLRHKLGIIIAVGVAAFADLGVKVALQATDAIPFMKEFEWPQAFTLIVTLWYMFTEFGSILENIGKLGAPIPPFLKKCIAVLKAKTEDQIVIEGAVEDRLDHNTALTGDDTPVGKHEKDQTSE